MGLCCCCFPPSEPTISVPNHKPPPVPAPAPAPKIKIIEIPIGPSDVKSNDPNHPSQLQPLTDACEMFFVTPPKRCKVVRVYDGDTIWVVFHYGDRYHKFKVRLYGLDTPELKPLRSMPNRDDEIRRAKIAKQALIDKIGDKVVDIEIDGSTKQFDKYGRLLGTIFLNGENINQWMIKQGYGVEYFGGTKQATTDHGDKGSSPSEDEDEI